MRLCTVKRPGLKFNCKITHHSSNSGMIVLCQIIVCSTTRLPAILYLIAEWFVGCLIVATSAILYVCCTMLYAVLYACYAIHLLYYTLYSGVVCSLPNYCNVCGQLWLTELPTTSGWSAKPSNPQMQPFDDILSHSAFFSKKYESSFFVHRLFFLPTIN